jgi:hypothetical protein
MNTIATIALVASLLFFVRQCGKDDVANAPDCVITKISEISKEDVWNPPAKIYSYVYEGQTVYFIPQHCCDIPSELFDSDCNLICNPDGGFSGRGDGKCADFFATRTDEKLLWEDTRK